MDLLKKLDNMITVEEFLQNHQTISHFFNDEYDEMMCFDKDIKQAMIEFAKLHVIEAKKEYHKVLMKQGIVTEAGIGYFDNVYPLENIK